MNTTEIVSLVSSIAEKSKSGRSDLEMEVSIALNSARLRYELGDRVLNSEECKVARIQLESQSKSMDLMADRINNSIAWLLLLPVFANAILQHFNAANSITIAINVVFVFSFIAAYFLFVRPFFIRYRKTLVAFQLAEETEYLATKT